MKMKHIFNIYAALFVGAAMMLGSCENRMSEEGNIGFTANVASFKGVGASTKAALIGDPADDASTYVPLFNTTYGTAGFTVSAYNGTAAKFTNATSTYSGGAWTLNQAAKWYSGETLDFYAIAATAGVSNFAVNASTKKITFDYTLPGVNGVDQPDVMVGTYSGTGVEGTQDGTRVAPLTFYHSLTAVRLKVGDIAGCDIVSTSITGVYHKGSCTVDVANLGTDAAFTWTKDTEYAPATGNAVGIEYNPAHTAVADEYLGGTDSTFMFIPTTFTAADSLFVVFKNPGTTDRFTIFSTTLDGVQFKAGKVYDLTVNFEGINLETFDEEPFAMIVPWAAASAIQEVTDPELMPVIAYLDSGYAFNNKLATLAGGKDNITKIVFDRFGAVDESGAEVQDDDDERSDEKIYASFDGGVVTITTHANTIYANADCKGLFQNFSNLTEIDFGDFFSTIETTDMSYMFAYCPAITRLNLIDVLDTGGVTNMTHMFDSLRNCTQLLLGNKFNTAAVTDMSYMFSNCRGITTLDLGLYFYTSNVTTMDHMFNYCSGLTGLDLKTHFDTSHVTNMNYMFYYCSMNRLHLNGDFTFAHNPAANYMFDRAFVSGADLYLTVAARNWISTHPETRIGSVHYNTI